MCVKQIETLLQQISVIVAEEKILREEKRKRGESFNIFNVLGLSTNEVRLHSALIAELLKTDGDHGLGDKFLDAFHRRIILKIKPDFELDTKSSKVSREFFIDYISEDKSTGGRIDILIKDKNNHSILIENKIYAGDQDKQLLRYENYAKANCKKYALLYLTLKGENASDASTDNNKVDYSCISYVDDIIPWLQNCIEIAALYPQVREVLVQYKLLLENILGIMSETNNKAIIDILIQDQNIDATLQIINLSAEVGITIREYFIINKLSKLAEKHNMTFSYDEKFVRLGTRDMNYKAILFKINEDDKCYFRVQNEGTSVYYGIVAGGYPEKQRKILRQFDDWSDGINIHWPYGYKYFPDNLRSWGGIDALTDMVKGNRILEIIDKELTRIIDNNLIEKLDSYLSGTK